MIRADMMQGDVNMRRPRREFNDMAMVDRLSIDQMAWSVYQPNDGDAAEGDIMNAWRSNAVRPIVRNKVFSIAAHVTAHTLFPRLFSFDKDSNPQEQAAQIMSDLIEYSVVQPGSTYADAALAAVIAALVNPVAIIYSQYTKVFRPVKRKKEDDGTWKVEYVLDEDLSGFQDEVVGPDEFFIQDFFQRDVQKQGWIIRRRVRPYTLLKTIYGKHTDFQYVKPGVQVIFNDANSVQFYESYDQTQRQDECEEVLYWNKSLDLFLTVINGVLVCDPENPNPREDKLYPFVTFGYEYLTPEGNTFYWKSLAFKTMPDDKIVNTLYPMIIDGSYLAIMPPMVNMGGEIIESDVIVPGRVTTFSSPDSDLKPLAVQNENLKAGFDALAKVEEDINEDAFNPMQQGEMPEGGGNLPAYTFDKMEKNAQLLMGPFVSMVGRYVQQMGRLRVGDIKQYLTLPEVLAIEGSDHPDLVYKTFLMPEGKGRSKSHKIKFDVDLPDNVLSPDEYLRHSYDILEEQGGPESKHSLSKVNPTLFRELEFQCFVGVDVMRPMSEWMEAAWDLQTYDRMVQAPNLYDPEETAKLLLSASPTTKKHPDKYLPKQGAQQQDGFGRPLAPNTTPAANVPNVTKKALSPSMPSPAMPMGA